ncbi:uncharacterized protein LOC122312612 [Carya illinoinensis]|uniref:uncharacterized protein LOC122312612 n=1 Tax=Carya illinoinensis TaxID=32201 RepID=UPI001C71B454|nr:uncharacterized protein LOC122312612 [Carya illinoinensis]
MVEDNLTKRWERLHLSKEETSVFQIKTKGAKEGNIQGKLCIISKVLSEKGVNNEAFRVTMSQIWRLQGWVRFKDLNEQCFLIEFQQIQDKERVLSSRPWFFDRNLITIQEVDENVSLNVLKFQYEPFWVQCHNLPLAAMTEEVGEDFGSSLGHVIRVDADSNGSAWGRTSSRPRFDHHQDEQPPMQFGAWLRAQPMNTNLFDFRKYGGKPEYNNQKEEQPEERFRQNETIHGKYKMVETEKGTEENSLREGKTYEHSKKTVNLTPKPSDSVEEWFIPVQLKLNTQLGKRFLQNLSLKWT